MRQEIESRTIDGVLTKIVFDDKTEYVERGALDEELKKAVTGYIEFGHIFDVVRERAKRVPAADVEPVVHAHAVYEDENDTTPHCSNCECGRDYFDNYCSNCGAKFDGAHMDERSGE